METRTRPPNGAAAHPEARRAEPRPGDERLNGEMTALLRQAAEGREERLRARTLEDERDARHATAALYALVDDGPRAGRR